MKTKTTLLIATMVLLILPTFGQYRLNNSTAMTLTGGYVSNGWNVNLGAEFIMKDSQHSIRVDAYYFGMQMLSNIEAAVNKVPVQNFTLAGGYAFSFCKYITQTPINISLGAGLHAGYESFNKKHGSLVVIPDPSMTYGLWASAQLEIYIASKISLVIEPRCMYFMSNKSVQSVAFIGNGGIKIHF